MQPPTVVQIPPTQDDEYKEVAWAVPEIGQEFKPIHINRPKVTGKQVKFKMLYAGICHTDVHAVKNEFGGAVFPFVPGHELLGEVTEIGSEVTRFKVGDKVGVGCLVDSCLDCEQCQDDHENYCDNQMTGTYNGQKKHGRVLGNPTSRTWGGYSGSNVVHEHFVNKIPDGLPLEKAAPIMCAGITMYDPLRHWGFTEKKDKVVGIVGIGGLGTMGIKIAKALGHQVVAISTSANKEALAKEKGADYFVVSTDPESIKALPVKCHIILNVVSANHDLNTYLPMLNKSGVLVQLGAAPQPHPIQQIPLLLKRQTVAGSLIGGMKATQEVLDLCAKHQIWPDCQTIKADQINWAFSELDGKNKDGTRYVIDVQGSIADGHVPKE